MIYTPGGDFQMNKKKHLTIIILTLKHILSTKWHFKRAFSLDKTLD